MQAELDRMFKETGHQNAISPYLYLKACLKQKKKWKDLRKECAIVTHYRLKNDPDKPGKLMVDPNAKRRRAYCSTYKRSDYLVNL
jgi:prolyl-tRNA synthetase